MNYETFKSSTLTSIQKYFGDDFTVSLHSVRKNNDIRLDGLLVQDRSLNIAPTIYLNYYYEDYLAGRPLADVLDDIIVSCQDSLPDHNMDFSFFTDYEQAKYHFIYRLINYSQNLDILKEIPHFRFLDLAVVFCCYLSDTPTGNATILIHNHHLDFWNITSDLLYDLAVQNTPILLPYEIKHMEDVLKAMCADREPLSCDTDSQIETPTMYFLSNTEKLYGSSSVLYPDLLSGFAKSIDSDLYVIPSSIHEVLLLPKDSRSNVSDLNHIIQDVNTSHLLKEEILSDHVYIYERTSGFLTP